MKHWLIVWGASAHAVRTGSGQSMSDAAMEAFGTNDKLAINRMSFKQMPLQKLRTQKHRIPAMIQLLKDHKARLNETEVTKAVEEELIKFRSLNPKLALS